MNVSLTALQGMFAQQTSEIFLTCIKLTSGIIIRHFVNDTQDLLRGSITYVGYPFQINLPSDVGDEQPQVQLILDNIDQELIRIVRGLTIAPTATLDVVLRSTPTVVEAGPYTFKVKSVQYDVNTITFQLGYEVELLDLPANKWRITPQTVPGTF